MTLNSKSLKLDSLKQGDLIIASRNDGFGTQMICFLNAMYLAQKSGMRFGFVWRGRAKRDAGDTCDLAGLELFADEFVEKYSYADILPCKLAFPIFQTLEQVRIPTTEFGHYYSVWQEPFEKYVKFLDYKDYRACIPKLWEQIGFSQTYKEVIETAQKDAKSLGDFVVVHIRSGDCVHSETQTQYLSTIYDKYYPIELLLLFISKLRDSIIVLISDDEFVLNTICATLSNQKLYKISDFRDFSGITCNDLYDVVFASKAKTIYHGHSNFLKLSYLIGGIDVNDVNYATIYSLKEQLNILKSIIWEQHYNNTLKFASLCYLYFLKKNLGYESNADRILCLESLLKYAPNNKGVLLILVLCYLDAGFIEKAESLLISVDYANNAKLFLSYNNILTRNRNEVLYFSLNNLKVYYPASCIFMSQYHQWKGNLKEAIKFAKLAYEKESQNERLKEYLLKLLLQQEQELFKSVAKLDFKANFCTAVSRIHSHLAYKLGSAMILNSKSLWGYIRMPYVLSYIKEAHKQEIAKYGASVARNPALKLPPLESYADYKDALKEKECFTYKLGQALITANSVQGGGRIFAYLAFFQEVRRLKKEFRGKRK